MMDSSTNSTSKVFPSEQEIAQRTWKLFAELGNLRGYREQLPTEECKTYFDMYCNVFVDSFFDKLNELQEWSTYTKKWTDERLGKSATTENIPVYTAKLLMTSRKTNLFEDIHLPTKIRVKFCESFRPDRIDMQD